MRRRMLRGDLVGCLKSALYYSRHESTVIITNYQTIPETVLFTFLLNFSLTLYTFLVVVTILFVDTRSAHLHQTPPKSQSPKIGNTD